MDDGRTRGSNRQIGKEVLGGPRARLCQRPPVAGKGSKSAWFRHA